MQLYIARNGALVATPGYVYSHDFHSFLQKAGERTMERQQPAVPLEFTPPPSAHTQPTWSSRRDGSFSFHHPGEVRDWYKFTRRLAAY